MIKSELLQRIAEQNRHLFRRDVEKIVNAMLDEIMATLTLGDRVELRGFGVFFVKDRPAYSGHNPRTGVLSPSGRSSRSPAVWPHGFEVCANALGQRLSRIGWNIFENIKPHGMPHIGRIEVENPLCKPDRDNVCRRACQVPGGSMRVMPMAKSSARDCKRKSVLSGEPMINRFMF